MANNYKQQFLYSYTKGLVSLSGPITLLSGTNGVDVCAINGATAARTGVGEITITFTDLFQAVVFADAQILAGTAQDLVPQYKAIDLTAKTAVIRLLTGGSVTDPTAGQTLYVNIFFRNSSINP